MPTDICSFSRLDFSDGGVEELARVVVHVRTVPLTGYRFTCTLKTFMKIETRRARPPMNAGSSTSVMSTTLPSAGAMTTLVAALAGALGIAEEVRDPERDEREQEGEQPERPRAPVERERVRAGRDERGDGDEDESFAGEAHVSGSEVRQVERRAGDAAERVEVARARRVARPRRASGGGGASPFQRPARRSASR